MTEGEQNDRQWGDRDILQSHLEIAGRILSLDDHRAWPRMLTEALINTNEPGEGPLTMAAVIQAGTPAVILHATGEVKADKAMEGLASDVFDSIDDDPIVFASEGGLLGGRIDAEHALIVASEPGKETCCAGRLREALMVFIPAILAVDRGHRLVETSRSLENHRTLERRIAELSLSLWHDRVGPKWMLWRRPYMPMRWTSKRR